MTWNIRKASALVWLSLGLLGGLLVAGFWPSVPLHAVTTDKIDTFSMATGPVDGDYEAVYFFDHLSGDLHAFIIGRSKASTTGYAAIAHYFRNIATNFKANGEKSPKYLMATGVSDLTRGGRGGTIAPSKAVLYIADVTSGLAAAYGSPADSNRLKAHDSVR